MLGISTGQILLCCLECCAALHCLLSRRRLDWASKSGRAAGASGNKTLAKRGFFGRGSSPAPLGATHGWSGCGNFRIEPAQRGHPWPKRAQDPDFSLHPKGAKAQNSAMNVLCNCGGRTPCIQRFCDSIPLVQARTDDVLAVADCIEEVRQAEAVELAELTAQWKMLVRAKFRKAVAALNEPGAVLPGAAAPAAAATAPVPTAAAPPPPEPSDNDDDNDDDDEAPPPPTGGAPPPPPEPEPSDDDDDDDEAPESDSDDERPVVVEMRRVGDTAWRGFAMQNDAAKAFGLTPKDVSMLVNHPTKRSGKLLQYEARRPVDSDGEERRPAANRSACEVRRVGDKKWRRFASRTDAAGVFPGLTKSYVCRLIANNPDSRQHIPQHIRDKYECRNAVEESDSDS